MRFLRSLFLAMTMFLAACSSEEQPDTYSIITVSDDENISETFAEYTGFPVIEYQHFTGLKAAQERYPGYKIDKMPTVLIFRDNGGELKQLQLKTNDLEEAKEWLEGILE
jgi:hypothetical protein